MGYDEVVGARSESKQHLAAEAWRPLARFFFDGQLGYLDHALASQSLLNRVTGATEWHINADEVPLLDYNDEIRDVPGEASFEREIVFDRVGFRYGDGAPVLSEVSFTIRGSGVENPSPSKAAQSSPAPSRRGTPATAAAAPGPQAPSAAARDR